MTEEKKYTEQEWHKRAAITLFNLVWSLLDKKDRTKQEDDKMVHAVHASRFHWGEIGTPVEFERGEWQISRVYSVLNRPQSALYHAERCLDICKENNIGDFDIAFAYEAMAFAYKVLGNEKLKTEFKKKGIHSLEDIKDKGDRDYAESELNKI